ncbi:DUF2189 domain-containing protein [Nitratireductor sp. L1-7-SE]|uniref:DUF2189 domain-containing protein n=1 Tax=Nitratireductor rhodophyticola TaxID=2854036 RepID=A0ABS7R6N6_9HYPH|nr:DUF2189 domain-containing protein [Nitratireductor rhodophyticola]MBY8916601.1 DUF2189 domain-containing protein [Nitratireductor rhodophyticola]MBY8921965.1 DUF2189 domain-containing protein [Nitratireductor rhodophyticola]
MADFHVMAGTDRTLSLPAVRKISTSDVIDALGRGLDDFWQKPSHYAFLCLIYPLVGVVLIYWASDANALPLLFPLASGFALLGPFAAIGLYEISRRREAGLDTSWRHALAVRKSPAIPSIIAVGAMLFAIFVTWLLVAQGLYMRLFGPEPPASISQFLESLFTTDAGFMLLTLGNAIGFIFALVVLITTAIAFPMLLDRDCGAVAAIVTSVRAASVNPLPIALWGVLVAGALLIGSLPLFAGLAVVMPILGHATWHLYRKVVAD